MSAPTEHKELKAEWKNEVQVKTYSSKDVAKHNTKKDLWIIVHGHVYDVTAYARDHPGGAEPLVEVAGADATSAYEDVGHSEDANEIMQAYLVGVLDAPPATESEKHEAQSNSTSSAVQIVRSPASDSSASQQEKNSSHHLNRITQVGAVTAGLGGLVWAVWTLSHSGGTPNSEHDPAIHVGNGRGSFIQGFAASLTVCGIAVLGSVPYLSKAMSFGPSFNQYSPHMQSASARLTNYHPSGVLTQDYRKYRLREKKELAEGIFKFVVDLPTKYSVLGLPIGQHVAIKASVDEHSVVRSYTPVSNNRDLGRLELLIRVYPDGKMGNFLKGLNVGDSIDIRGPKGAMRYRRGMCTAIGMIAGGTGITPMYQIIRAICEDPKDDTKVTLVYGNRSEEDILLRRMLDHYAATAKNKFKIYYTLDQPSKGWEGGSGYVTKELLEKLMPKPSKETKVMLCGPPGMVNGSKKNLVELGFEEPGAVGKMTDQIFCF